MSPQNANPPHAAEFPLLLLGADEMAADKNTPALVLCRCVQRVPTSLGEAALCSGGLSSSKEQPELSSTLCPLLPEFILLPVP